MPGGETYIQQRYKDGPARMVGDMQMRVRMSEMIDVVRACQKCDTASRQVQGRNCQDKEREEGEKKTPRGYA
jgi:RNase P subunit RPR2